MSKLYPSLVLAACVLAALVPLPSGLAFAPGEPMVALYMQGGGMLGTQVPTAAGTVNALTPSAPAAAGAPQACASGPVAQARCGPTILGVWGVPDNLVVSGNAGLTLWISSNMPQGVVLRAITVELQLLRGAATTVLFAFSLEGGANAAQAELSAPRYDAKDPGPQVQPITNLPVALRLAATLGSPVLINEGEKLSLVITRLHAFPAVHSVGDVFVHYGPQRATGLIVNAAGPRVGLYQAGTTTLGLYLGENRLRLAPPTATAASARPIGSSTDLVAPDEVLWGQAVIDENTTIAADALFRIDLRQVPLKPHESAPVAGAGPRLSLQVRLQINATDYFGSTNTGVAPAQGTAPSSALRFIGVLPVRGVAMPPGTVVKLAVSLTAASASHDYEVLFGSATSPSGVRIPVSGGGNLLPEDDLNTTVPTTPVPTTTTSSSPPPTTSPPASTEAPPTTTTQSSAASSDPTTPPTSDSTSANAHQGADAKVKDVSQGQAPGLMVPAVLAGLGLAALMAGRAPRRPY